MSHTRTCGLKGVISQVLEYIMISFRGESLCVQISLGVGFFIFSLFQ